MYSIQLKSLPPSAFAALSSAGARFVLTALRGWLASRSSRAQPAFANGLRRQSVFAFAALSYAGHASS
jgi:hypothetical protein